MESITCPCYFSSYCILLAVDNNLKLQVCQKCLVTKVVQRLQSYFRKTTLYSQKITFDFHHDLFKFKVFLENKCSSLMFTLDTVIRGVASCNRSIHLNKGSMSHLYIFLQHLDIMDTRERHI